MRTLVVGEQPEGYDVGDAYHHVLMTILIAARAHGVAAVDGPYLKVRDVEAFRRVAGRSAALGYDGKWVLHPDQIAAGNEIFSPRQQEYDHAELILEAYEWHTSTAGGARGAVMLGDEMIDEASRKMALVIAGKGRAAGMTAAGSGSSAGLEVLVGAGAGHDEDHEQHVEQCQCDDGRADRHPATARPKPSCPVRLVSRIATMPRITPRSRADRRTPSRPASTPARRWPCRWCPAA